MATRANRYQHDWPSTSLGAVDPFGSMAVSNITPIIQAYLEHADDTRIWNQYLAAGGTVSIANGHADLDIGTTVGAYSVVQTKKAVSYQPGESVFCRFTAQFDTPVALSTQIAGPYSAEDGYGFGYDGTDFGTLHRVGRKLEIQALTVTGAAGARS